MAGSTVTPSVGTTSNSYEVIVDINTGTEETPTWTNIPDITAFAPTPANKMIDTTTYAHKGNTAQSKVGEDFTATFNALGIRGADGEFQEYILALLALSAPETRGADAVGHFRYYDSEGASYAYEFTATVQDGRANTGNADPNFFTFTLTSQGDRKSIPNPVATP